MNGCSILISSALLVSTGFAHEDPNGDVHPLVTVEKGNFVVWFINSTEKRTAPESNANAYRTVIAADGSTIVVRQPVPNTPSSIPDWAVKLGSLYPFDTKDRLGLGLPLKCKEPVSNVDGITEHRGTIAHIGPRILIAWHEGFGGVALSRSKVWTHLVDLETAVFRSELPYSRGPSNALPISAQSPP